MSLNNTKRHKALAVFAVFVLVAGCIFISFLVKNINTQNATIIKKIETITELKEQNADLQKRSDETNKKLNELQEEMRNLKQEQEIRNKEIESLKNKISFLPTSMKIDRKVSTVVTAYTVDECGKSQADYNYGVTATGTHATVYKTVAVDPSVIPLGSYIYIPQFANYPNKGIFHAEDTGQPGLFGVDVLVYDGQSANEIGRSVKDVYILK